MPNNGDTSNYTSVFRLTPPNDPHRKVIKRNRQVVSCVPCRTRKLKCDRQQPCNSCVKRSDVASCRFFGTPNPSGASHAPSPVPRTEMQARLQKLEVLVNGLKDQPEPDVPTGRNSVGGAITREPWMTDSGHRRDEAASPDVAVGQSPVGERLDKEGDNVRFVGATNYAAVLEAIRELQGVIDAEAPDHLSTRSPQSQSQAGERHDTHQPRTPSQAHLYGPVSPLTTQEILDRLPSRDECDKVLTFYFQPVHIVPMIIHGPQFQRTYRAFWEDPGSASPLWISTLFSFLSTAVFQQASKAAGGEGLGATDLSDPVAREKIEDLSSMAHRCLVTGGFVEGKPYSVEAGLLFGMHLVLQKRDTEPICWHTFGTAVRLAQRMGYHRDPVHINGGSTKAKISPFEAEMRRRTWYSLEYFDLLYSFLLGIPPIIHGDDVDTQLPSNLRDEDFDEDCKSLPPSRPSTDFTTVLCYVYNNRQVQVLRRIVKQALAVVQPLYADVIRLDADLRDLHNDVPPSLSYRPIRESGFADVPDIIMRRIQFEITHLKSMCVLHRRYLTFERENSIYERSREACRDASLRLLDLQAEFDEQSGEGGRLYEKRYLLTNMAFHDFLLAAMCLCLDLVVGHRNSNLQDHERKVSALKRARVIWGKTTNSSKEAAHATKVLDIILARVSTSSDGATGTASPSLTTDSGRRFTVASASSDNISSSTSSPAGLLQCGTPPIQAGWMAVNYAGSSRKTGEHSKEWDFGFDKIDRRHAAGKPGNQLGLFPGNDVDWNEIDSFLFDREHIPGSSVSSTAATDDATSGREGFPYISHGGEKENSREGWPYPNYGGRARVESTTNFRTWARGGN
ncbi:hypothetical protein VMCG_07598 [Cytospora schulzeri]|uniref:Zn(2)-C6 fungal-type domain-containing protein n=1 Tax=Cytospora schulzeri TaxID=448051 RepID=A0A423VXC3_9PEZI|nr:hypothetical protein VMCG_07598 [Valsa malicola]